MDALAHLAGYGSTDSENEDGDATNNNVDDATGNYVDMAAVFAVLESHCEDITASNATSATAASGTSTVVGGGPAARAAARSAKPMINAFSVMGRPGKRRADVQPAASAPNRSTAAEQQQPSSPSLTEAAAAVAAENAAAALAKRKFAWRLQWKPPPTLTVGRGSLALSALVL